jgi:hypothetical protein
MPLTDSVSSTSTTTAATPNSVKTAYDLANTANTTAGTAIPKATVTAAGDLIYASGSATVTRLAIGSATQILAVGTAGAPVWQDSSAADITEVVAGAGLTGGASAGTATLTVGAGTGITVNADDVAIDTSVVPVKTDNLSVFAASTAAAIGVGTVELGHANDTTLSRSASGVLAVEGVDVLTTSGTQTVSNKTLGTDLAAGGFKITGLGAPSSANDAATKTYVDSVAEGLDIKESVLVATTANITLSGYQTIDGYSITQDNLRVLVKDQTTLSENGIYLTNSSTWTRAADANTTGDLDGGSFVWVELGTTNGDSGWAVTSDGTITIGASNISWVQFSGAGQITAGTALAKSGNTLNVQLTDSTSSTSTTTAATPASVKSAYDLAAGKIASVSGTSPISVTAGTAPTVSVSAASTAASGVVQLTDSTSSTSTTTAATPNSVKTAYDLASAAIPKNTATTAGDLLYASGSATITRLAVGSAGQVLTVGTAGVPVWGTAASGGGASVDSILMLMGA